MTIERENYRPAIIISRSGGVDIETVAKKRPEDMLTFHFSMSESITPDILTDASQKLNASPKESEDLAMILKGVFGIFAERDATLLEVNLLFCSADGSHTYPDAKFTFDNAARKHHHGAFEEVEAEKCGRVFVRMDGNNGNVVNGAGLAMATNDASVLYGGSSANLLDAGGQAIKQTVVKAFGIVMANPRVTTIFVNIYRGIID